MTKHMDYDRSPVVNEIFVSRQPDAYIKMARVVTVEEGYVMYQATADDGCPFMDVMKIESFNYLYTLAPYDRARYVNLYNGDCHHDSLESANHHATLYAGVRLGVLFLLPDGTTGFLSENEARRER